MIRFLRALVLICWAKSKAVLSGKWVVQYVCVKGSLGFDCLEGFFNGGELDVVIETGNHLPDEAVKGEIVID